MPKLPKITLYGVLDTIANILTCLITWGILSLYFPINL